MRTTLLFTALLITLASCARYAHGSARVALGMTHAEVERACGEPYLRTTNSSSERWYYHDASWDDSSRKGDPDNRFTEVVFIGGSVAAFGPYYDMVRNTPSPATATPRSASGPATGPRRATPHSAGATSN